LLAVLHTNVLNMRKSQLACYNTDAGEDASPYPPSESAPDSGRHAIIFVCAKATVKGDLYLLHKAINTEILK